MKRVFSPVELMNNLISKHKFTNLLHFSPLKQRCTSLNVIRDPYAPGRPGLVSIIPDVSPTPNRSGPNNNNNNNSSILNNNNNNNSQDYTQKQPGNLSGQGAAQQQQQQPPPGSRDSRSLPGANRLGLGNRSVSQDSVYTILIRLPSDGGAGGGGAGGGGGANGQAQGEDRAPSIKMIQDDVPLPLPHPSRRQLPSRDSEYSLPITRRPSHAQDIRIPLNAKIIPKPIVKPLPAPRQIKKKKKSQEKKQETKAAKTLSAILLSFIITWTPYNILVLLKPLTGCTKCFPQELWDFFYALCYINSTINPVCYALCNASFRRTYVRILTCKWHTRNREAMTRGVYN